MPSIKPDGSVNSVPQSDSNGLVAQYALRSNMACRIMQYHVTLFQVPSW